MERISIMGVQQYQRLYEIKSDRASHPLFIGQPALDSGIRADRHFIRSIPACLISAKLEMHPYARLLHVPIIFPKDRGFQGLIDISPDIVATFSYRIIKGVLLAYHILSLLLYRKPVSMRGKNGFYSESGLMELR